MERKTQGRILALFCLLFLPALAFSQIMVKGTVKTALECREPMYY